MFTGLVEEAGTLRGRTRRGPGYRLSVQTGFAGLQLGESVAVNGACLTVSVTSGPLFEADVSIETAERTTLGELAVGASVNLERALRLGDRMGGHLVSGHVDAVVAIDEVVRAGEARQVWARLPDSLGPYLAEKGSVALDGVSLTVNAVSADRFAVMLVPHTRGATNLSDLSVGKRLNLEVDLLARYVVRYLTAAGAAAPEQASGASSRASDAAGRQDEPLLQALKRSGIL